MSQSVVAYDALPDNFFEQIDDLKRRIRVLEDGQFVAEETSNDVALSFTGTDYDTKAACGAAGLCFSDEDTPFPDTLGLPISGTWTHSAGNGWEGNSSTDNEGPGLLIRLDRPGNWEIEVAIDFGQTAVQGGFLFLGYIANSNHVGAYGRVADPSAASIVIQERLYTNDGDDTYTSRWSVTTLPATGVHTFKFRCKNGCVSYWSPNDLAWHDYEDRQNVGDAYTAGWVFLQIAKYTLAMWTNVYLSSLKLTYLT